MIELDQKRSAGIAGSAVLVAFLLGLVPQGVTEAAITAALPEIAHDLGKDGEFVAQMMMGMGALGLLLGALASGRILELAGTRYTYIGAILAFGLCGSTALITHDVTLLFASRVIVGFSASCIATTCLWGINARFSTNVRAGYFSAAGAVGGASTIASIILGGLLTQHLGWRYCFIIYPAIALMALPVVWIGVSQEKPQGITFKGRGYLGKLVPLYAVVVAFYFVIGMASMQLPFLLDGNGMQDAGIRSLVQSLPGIATIVGASSFGMLQQRLGATRTFVGSIVFLCIGLLMYAAATMAGSLILPALGACAVGICMGVSAPYFFHIVGCRTDVESAGRYLGYLNAVTFLGAFINPLIASPIKASLGIAGLFLVGAVLAFFIGLILVCTKIGIQENS